MRYRSTNVEAKIEEALNLVGLKTEPPFAQASIDDPLLFLLQSPANDPVPNARRQQNKLNFRPPSQPHDWTVYSLRDKLDRGQLELQPTYKREYVWKLRPELPWRLIESLLLEIPIPPIYFGKMAGGLRLEVIDGQQRLTTMMDFINDKFPLQRLQRMATLNGKSFKELPEEHRAKILDAPIRNVVIDAGNQ